MMIKSAVSTAFLAIIGGVILGLSMYFARKTDEPKRILPQKNVPVLQTTQGEAPVSPEHRVAEVNIPPSEPPVSSPVAFPNVVSGETLSSQAVDLPANNNENEPILITVDWDGQSFTSSEWSEIKDYLENKSDIKISFEFAQKNIPDEEKFRRWIATANYYVLARRILLIGDTSFVLKKDRHLLPVKWHETAVHGFIVLTSQGEKYELTIRGLEDFPKELIRFSENIILRALKNPSSIAEQQEVSVRNLSQMLSDFNYELNGHQSKMTDILINRCTSSQAWETQEGEFFGSYLPLIDMGLLKNETEQSDTELCKNYWEKVGLDLNGKDKTEISNNPRYFKVVFSGLVNWVSTTKFDEKVATSLFK